MQSAILLLVFNRPNLTKLVFEQIRNAKPARLYIAADGARPDKPGEIARCQEVRQIVSQVDWSCIVETRFSTENLGCKMAVSSAITWFFSKETEGIIIEDDCLPNQDFFDFCDHMLSKYREDQRIGAICGTNLYDLYSLRKNKNESDSYYFSTATSVWGWATWKRVWDEYDSTILDWNVLKNNNAFKSNFSARKWRQIKYIFNSTFSNKIDTWDYQFSFLLLKSNRLSIIPNSNLIENIGFNMNATHTKNKFSPEAYNKTCLLSWPLHEPIGIVPSVYKDNYMDWIYSSKIIRHIVYRIKKVSS
jgi:hypothetical protein